MPSQLLIFAVLIPAIVAYQIFVRRKLAGARASLGPVLHDFFERTDYRYPGVEGGAEAQVREYQRRESQASAGGFEMTLVRDYHGLRLRHDHRSGSEKRGTKTVSYLSCSWSAQLPSPPRVRWQAAARSLDSGLKTIKESFTNVKRNWKAQYPVKVTSGDAELDDKLVFYGENEADVRRALATPGLKEALLSVVELDLVVGDAQIAFADPLQKNMTAGLGGTLGNMALGFDAKKRFELAIPVHDRIAELLALAARASSA
jgi:hypothetical protein